MYNSVFDIMPIESSNYSSLSHSNFPFELMITRNTLENQLMQEIMRNSHLKLLNEKRILQEAHEKTNENYCSERVKVEEKQVEQAQPLRKKRKFECKIETKNLPKNFGKAIIAYIQNNPNQVSEVLNQQGIVYSEFLSLLMEKRPNINTIMSLREFWLNDFIYAKQMRKISMYFLRKHSFKYIFGSRIKNLYGHIKYRKRLIEAITQPEEFTSIKTFKYKCMGKRIRKH